MIDKYYVGLKNYCDCIEIEPTIKDKFLLKVPSWDMDITTQDLIAIKNKIEEILRDEQKGDFDPEMNYSLPHYKAIDTRLVDTLIPDYGLHMDSQILHRRGKKIKSLFPALHDWPETTLAEAEMYLEGARKIDKRIGMLTLPQFLILLFNPECRVNWGVWQ